MRSDKTDDVKDSIYEELEYVFDKFFKYRMTLLLGDFIANLGSENMFKLTYSKSLEPFSRKFTFCILGSF
jgi:hypothetical protein